MGSQTGGGTPLDEQTRSFMEPRFGADFNQVRVHTDTTAVQMNKELGAQAFAHGSDIYFGAGKTPGKNELTAHELTHVVQQGGAVRMNPAKKLVNPQVSAKINKEPGLIPKQDHSESAQLKPLEAKQLPTDTTSRASNKDLYRFPHETQALQAKQLPNSDHPLDSNKEPHLQLKNTPVQPLQAKRLTTATTTEPQNVIQRNPIDATKDWVWKQLTKFGNLGKLLWNHLSDSWSLLVSIAKNPEAFIKNLVTALRQGLQNFVKNILGHLQAGFVSWLTGGLGVQQEINLKIPQSIFSLALGLLGMNWSYVRQKAAKKFGEPNVKKLETSFDVFITLKTKGLVGLWSEIKQKMGDLTQAVVEEIKSMLIKQVVIKAVELLLKTLVPGGAIAKLAEACYQILSFLIEKVASIAEVAITAIGAVKKVASGDVGGAAGAVEQALSKSIPLLMGFLAGLVGIKNLAQKVKGALSKLKKKIDDLVDKLFDRAKKWLAKLPTNKVSNNPKKSNKVSTNNTPKKPTSNQKDVKAITNIETINKVKQKLHKKLSKGIKQSELKKFLSKLKIDYKLNTLTVKYVAKNKLEIFGKINPEFTLYANKIIIIDRSDQIEFDKKQIDTFFRAVSILELKRILKSQKLTVKQERDGQPKGEFFISTSSDYSQYLITRKGNQPTQEKNNYTALLKIHLQPGTIENLMNTHGLAHDEKTTRDTYPHLQPHPSGKRGVVVVVKLESNRGTSGAAVRNYNILSQDPNNEQDPLYILNNKIISIAVIGGGISDSALQKYLN